MPHLFVCPYLGADVELTDEREAHILARHADLRPDYPDLIATNLADPDAVHLGPPADNRLLFSRWYDGLQGGKYVLVVVASQADVRRHWIVTAYMLRKPVPGEPLWQRS
jgi:hypothetical protein